MRECDEAAGETLVDCCCVSLGSNQWTMTDSGLPVSRHYLQIIYSHSSSYSHTKLSRENQHQSGNKVFGAIILISSTTNNLTSSQH